MTTQTDVQLFKPYPKGTINTNKYQTIDKTTLSRYTYLIINTETGEHSTSNSLCSIDTKIKELFGSDTQLNFNNKQIHLLAIGKYEILIPNEITAITSYDEVIKVQLYKNLMSNEMKRILNNYNNGIGV